MISESEILLPTDSFQVLLSRLRFEFDSFGKKLLCLENIKCGKKDEEVVVGKNCLDFMRSYHFLDFYKSLILVNLWKKNLEWKIILKIKL